MKEKRSFYLLLFIMTVVAIVVMLVSNAVLYKVAFEEKKKSLVETAQSQARLIEAMARYNRRTNRIDWEVPVGERGPTSLLSERAAADTIEQLRDAHNHYEGFGDTGEFVLAGIEQEQIVFLLRHRHGADSEPEAIPFYSDIAEPIRKALLAESGVMVGKDYRGVDVLAAYEPVDVLNLGIVAKIDLAEIQAPFIRAIIVTSIVAMIVIILGSLLFRKVTNPIIESIKNNEKQYRALVEEINEWVWAVDSKGVLTYSSPQIENLIGYKHDDLIGLRLIELFESNAQEKALQLFTNKGDTRLPIHNYEVIIQGLEQRSVAMEFSASPIIKSDGEFIGYRGVAHDISQRKEAERLQEEYQLKLEQQVQERTEALHSRNEEMKKFTYIVSHDLRSPLVSIIGFSGELRTDIKQIEVDEVDKFTEESKVLIQNSIPEALNYIEHATEKMEGLINSILSLSRIGGRELIIEQVDCAEVVDKNLKALGFQLESVSVDIGELPSILSDRLALEQIFGNLLGNAVKFLQLGRPAKIAIWSEQTTEYIYFYIQDNGQGIAEKDLPHIFELFKRVGEQKAPGDGMGLTYVQALVRRLDGQIRCESIYGEGTTFCFYFPC